MRGSLLLPRYLALAWRAHPVALARPVLPVTQVGCSSWVGARRLSTPSPKLPDDDNNGAEFMDEVELDGAEWEGEEVAEGVFVSTSQDGIEAREAPSSVQTPRRPSRTSIKHLNRLLSRHQSPDVPESELEEKFVRGRGPGGQAINKTNSCVSLIHLPTGIRIQSQPTRSREQNRQIARQILRERLDLMRARGEFGPVEEAVDMTQMNRKDRLAAEARTFSKQELRWEKERRRKLNKKKKHKRKERDQAEASDDA